MEKEKLNEMKTHLVKKKWEQEIVSSTFSFTLNSGRTYTLIKVQKEKNL